MAVVVDGGTGLSDSLLGFVGHLVGDLLDRRFGVLDNGLKCLGAAHSSHHAVDLVIPLTAGASAEVIAGGETGHQSQSESHAPLSTPDVVGRAPALLRSSTI